MPMFAESSAFPAYEAVRLRDLLFPPERQSLHGYAKATITGAYPYVSWIMRIAEAEPWKGKKEMPKVRRSKTLDFVWAREADC